MKIAILLSFDCLPARLIGCYGNSSVCTPNFDRLAADSIVFDQHHCVADELQQAVTPDPENHDEFVCEQFSDLDLEFPQVPYQFASTPMVRMIRQWKEVVTCGMPSQDVVFHLRSRGITNSWRVCDELQLNAEEFEDAEEDIAAELRAAVAKETTGEEDERWFGGWEVPPDDFSMQDCAQARARAECFVEMLDAALGIVLDTIADTDHLHDALLIVTAQRGMDFGESRARGRDLARYGPEWTHTPLFMSCPGASPARRSVLSTSADIAATVAGWLGQSAATTTMKPADSWGCSLLPALDSNAVVRREIRLPAKGTRVIQAQDFVLTTASGANPELHVRPDDPWLVHNVATEYPHVIEELLNPAVE